MFSTLTTTVLVSRLAVRARLTSRTCTTTTTTATSSDKERKPKLRSVSIGGLTKTIKPPKNPELVPIKYLPKDSEIPVDTLKQLRWMMQKDLLGQDIFLIGRPSPLRRKLALQYLELTQRELEFVSLTRDTTESDLKQRREISAGTAYYIDQSAVRAASHGRILVLEGIEKAERNVLPVLNNLLENREMHLEDGRLLIPASRYDKLLEEHSQEELDGWQLVRVSEDFRVIALGLPVPQYIGNPLDPPLRSRFQAKDIRYLPFREQLEVLQPLAQNLPNDNLNKILSFAHTLMTEEASNLGLPDFPIENLPSVVSALNSAPNLSPSQAIERLYPYKLFLPVEGCQSVEQTLQTFQLLDKNPQGATSIESISNSDKSSFSNVEIRVGRKFHRLSVTSGNRQIQELSDSNVKNYVPTSYHESLLADLMLSHSVKDFCIVGPRGCGKSLLAERLAALLGYDVEPVQLYQDMTGRDLLQQRTTLENGDTVWRYSPLVSAAIQGRVAILDGIHRIHRGTLAVLHRLVHDRELQLYDGTRLLRSDRYEEAKRLCGLTDRQMEEDRKIMKISENFRVIALAEPPTLGGSGKGQWLTPEILSMFLFHSMRPLSQEEERAVLSRLTGPPGDVMKDVLALTHRLRDSTDSSLTSIATSLSTRQLLRISKRLKHFPEEDAYHAIRKACLARFLPTLARETLEKEMAAIGILKTAETEESLESEKRATCRIENGVLTIGTTSSPLYNPSTKTKIPETLFYDTYQNISSMEALLRDFQLGEHLLLVGNQGVGKNKLVDRLLNLLNRPREYIQLHRDTTVQSLTLQPTVIGGVIVYEDSPLVKAVKQGHILVVDEADKAPLHVTCILKTLVESGEMMLSDGRRIVSRPELFDDDNVIKMNPDFRMFVLANRPGFPFLGNDFFASLGDLFSCHAIDNPSMEAELAMLRQYGPNVPENTLIRLVKAFSDLRHLADEGQITYPYSTREVVNIVKHLELFPDEGLGNVVRNVFDFDSYDKEAKETLDEILHKHGIPIGSSPMNVSLARQFELPKRQLVGHWERRRATSKSHFIQVPMETRPMKMSGPQQVTVYRDPLDRIEARGLGFSEMQSYWSLPFHDFAVVGDVAVVRDEHNRQLQDTIHVVTSNPVCMYVMKGIDNKCSRLTLNHFFDTRRQNIIPRIRLASLSGRFENIVALHEEVSNTLLLVDPTTGTVLRLGSSNLLDTVKEFKDRLTGAGQSAANLYRLKTDFSKENKLLFYTPEGNNIELIDLSDEPTSYRIELPINIKSLHPLSQEQYLVVASDNATTSDNIFILKKNSEDEPIPTVLNPIQQNVKRGHKKVDGIWQLDSKGLSDFCLKMALGEKVSSPNTVMVTDKSYATLVVGFPELEFSPNEIYAWPKPHRPKEPVSTQPGSQKYSDPSRNIIFLRDSCQIVKPISPRDLPAEFTKDNYGLASPGNVAAFLEVVDLADSKLRYIPIPEPVEMSVYASWYKKTYPDQIVGCAPMSHDGLVTVDNAGTVRLWETGTANLEKSLLEWRRMIGDEGNRDMMIHRDLDPNDLANLDPKHGKVDEKGDPHVGGNTWAGGTGGRGTAGLGGLGGPYRLDAGHNVHQVSDEMKAQVPEEVLKAARQMNRKAYEERLRQIKMSQYDAEIYEKFASQVRKQVQALRLVINGLQAKAKDRQWLKNQTMGELDDTKLIEGITGEKSIYKKRGEQDPEPGAPQEKPKRLRLLVDVSGSMYRFNGHDLRLERTLESALMVMEALEGYGEKFKYDVFGHSGEESALQFVKINHEPKNEKERLEVLQSMSAHAQFCMSGDHTLSATVQAINELSQSSENYDESFVIVLSDANFDRYGISPSNFAKILNRSNEVAAFAIFIGSLGDQADRLAKKLPSGKGFVCLDTKKIPEIMKTIFTSTMLK